MCVCVCVCESKGENTGPVTYCLWNLGTIVIVSMTNVAAAHHVSGLEAVGTLGKTPTEGCR
jgi:hypothetical protein